MLVQQLTNFSQLFFFNFRHFLHRYLSERNICSDLFLNDDDDVLFSASFMVYLRELKRYVKVEQLRRMNHYKPTFSCNTNYYQH